MRLKRMARDEAANVGTDMERWRVLQPTPLVIEQVEGDLTLEDGDPDFTIGDTLRQHVASYGLSKDDQVLVAHSGDEWHAFDAASNTTPVKAKALKAGAYTITGDTATRTLHVASASVEDVANVLATVIRDLGGA
jgi:hypothetical protein